MREALTIIGFLLIMAFAALFAAPLYVDWNAWRDDIAGRLSQHFGAPVTIKGAIQARLLPQPWLSVSDVSIGAADSKTRLSVGAIDGDVSLGGLMRGDISLSNVVIRRPELTLAASADGQLEPLARGKVSAKASIESFEIQDGIVRYSQPGFAGDVTVSDVHLVGESGSLFGPYKAEGGARFGGVTHTIKLSTGVASDKALRVRVSAVPADRPLTADIEGEIQIIDGRPGFTGSAALVRPAVGDSPDDDLSQVPWRVSGPVSITREALSSDKLAVQVGSDERAVKLTGTLNLSLGASGVLDISVTGSQLDLDRLAGLKPGERKPPAAVLAMLAGIVHGQEGMPQTAHISLMAQGAMLGGELMRDISSDLSVQNGQWRVGSFEAVLPGQSRLQLAGDLGSNTSGFNGNLSLRSERSTGLLGWLQGAPVLGAPDTVRKLTLVSDLKIDEQSVILSGLAFSIGDAKVTGKVAWKRLTPGRNAGRVEADLAARRIDLDQLPSLAALLPGAGDVLKEADVRLAAQSLTFAGIEAKSVSGRVKAGGKLVALEDVVVNDLGGANLMANGRIDNIGRQSQGEIRILLKGRDLTGLATALRHSTLPPYWVEAFAARAAALSPANASLAIAFGTSRRYSVDGKFGNNVAQFDAEFSGEGNSETIDTRLKVDSLDVATLMRQIGFSPSAMRIADRASLRAEMSGPLNGARRWSIGFNGAAVTLSGSGKMTGPFEMPSLDGRFRAGTDDALVPAQLFGVALPGVMPAQSLTIDSGFRGKGGRFSLDDVSGTWLGMPVNGALTVTFGGPARLEGRLSFLRADAQLLGSLFAGADLGGANSKGNAWAENDFGPTAFDNLVGKLSVSSRSLRLSRRLPDLGAAKADISFGNGKVSVDDFSAKLADGSITGALQLSRAALDTAATGHLVFSDIGLDTQYFGGRIKAGLDFQGTGRSPDALVSSLTGGGAFEVRDLILQGFSRDAFGDTITAADGGLALDIDHVKSTFEDALARKPETVGAVAGNVMLAGGVLRFAPVLSKLDGAGLLMSGVLDLGDLTAKANLVLTPAEPKDGVGGPAPTIPILVNGELDSLRREADVSGLTAWLSIRAAELQARQLELLEAKRQAEEKIQDDVRRAEAAQMQKAIEEARRKAQQGQGGLVNSSNGRQGRPATVSPSLAPVSPGSRILGQPPANTPLSTDLLVPPLLQAPKSNPLTPILPQPDGSIFQKPPQP